MNQNDSAIQQNVIVNEQTTTGTTNVEQQNGVIATDGGLAQQQTSETNNAASVGETQEEGTTAMKTRLTFRAGTVVATIKAGSVLTSVDGTKTFSFKKDTDKKLRNLDGQKVVKCNGELYKVLQDNVSKLTQGEDGQVLTDLNSVVGTLVKKKGAASSASAVEIVSSTDAAAAVETTTVTEAAPAMIQQQETISTEAADSTAPEVATAEPQTEQEEAPMTVSAPAAEKEESQPGRRVGVVAGKQEMNVEDIELVHCPVEGCGVKVFNDQLNRHLMGHDLSKLKRAKMMADLNAKAKAAGLFETGSGAKIAPTQKSYMRMTAGGRMEAYHPHAGHVQTPAGAPNIPTALPSI